MPVRHRSMPRASHAAALSGSRAASHCPSRFQWRHAVSPRDRFRGAEDVLEQQRLDVGGRNRPVPSRSGIGGDEQRTVLRPVGRAAVGAPHKRCVERYDVHEIAHAEHLLCQTGCDPQFRQP